MYIAFLFVLLYCQSVHAQQHIGYIDPQYDSLKSYDVFLESLDKGFYTEYKVNGKVVTREYYNKYNLQWNSMGACKPCYLYTFDEQDHLLHVAFQYKDCIVGIYREYFPEGGIKVIGQFKENTTGDWDHLFERQLCNVRIGRWQYFNMEGKLFLIESYDEYGKLFEKQAVDMDNEEEENTKPKLYENIKNIFNKE